VIAGGMPRLTTSGMADFMGSAILLKLADTLVVTKIIDAMTAKQRIATALTHAHAAP